MKETQYELEKTTKLLFEKINEILQDHTAKTYITVDELVALEYDLYKLFVNMYEPLFNFDIKDHIEVTLKLSIEKASIGVYPNNLFTSLLTTNRYRNDMHPSEIEENNLYIIEDGLLASFNPTDKTIIKRKAH